MIKPDCREKRLASVMLCKSYGSVMIRLEVSKGTHVETETRRMWRYQDLQDQMAQERSEVAHNE